jgi:hypothetical protein
MQERLKMADKHQPDLIVGSYINLSRFLGHSFPILPNADWCAVHFCRFSRPARGCRHGTSHGFKELDVRAIGLQLFHGPRSISCGLSPELS